LCGFIWHNVWVCPLMTQCWVESNPAFSECMCFPGKQTYYLCVANKMQTMSYKDTTQRFYLANANDNQLFNRTSIFTIFFRKPVVKEHRLLAVELGTAVVIQNIGDVFVLPSSRVARHIQERNGQWKVYIYLLLFNFAMFCCLQITNLLLWIFITQFQRLCPPDFDFMSCSAII